MLQKKHNIIVVAQVFLKRFLIHYAFGLMCFDTKEDEYWSLELIENVFQKTYTVNS